MISHLWSKNQVFVATEINKQFAELKKIWTEIEDPKNLMLKKSIVSCKTILMAHHIESYKTNEDCLNYELLIFIPKNTILFFFQDNILRNIDNSPK